MEPDYRYPQVYTVGSHPNLTCYPTASAHPVLVPTLKRGKKDWQKVCTVMILILTFIILASLVLGAFYLFQLQKKLDKIKQVQDGEGEQAKIVGSAGINKPTEIVAHLTGMNVIKSSTTLVWDSVKGLAFVQGVSHSAEELIIIEAGYYLIYTKVYFRGQECQSDMLLEHTVLKRSDRYPVAIEIMKTRNSNNCPGNNGQWSRDSFQSGIFKLTKGDRIYVTVSNPALVNFEQFNTFFGLHKL
ncbi:tumor necrosis factor ligand superfamily member 6-like [Scyliorhinus canicula]|uniref:tumor necrosis factor ligand superfamily member 6-like n=1 Tax=Scyliorhinus canicula TaxID=7830 RepID=UPI0018F718CE|nr:tumor necrosis factor ligand superfamily member 6-like [Scyliorhinus canicula]